LADGLGSPLALPLGVPDVDGVGIGVIEIAGSGVTEVVGFPARVAGVTIAFTVPAAASSSNAAPTTLTHTRVRLAAKACRARPVASATLCRKACQRLVGGTDRVTRPP